jgi:hypothetical protein
MPVPLPDPSFSSRSINRFGRNIALEFGAAMSRTQSANAAAEGTTRSPALGPAGRGRFPVKRRESNQAGGEQQQRTWLQDNSIDDHTFLPLGELDALSAYNNAIFQKTRSSAPSMSFRGN